MTRYYFRLKNGDWGYVDAEDREHAAKLVKAQHGRKPVHIERA
jgi:hypothetical protein